LEEYITVAEAHERYGYSTSHLTKLLRDGEVKGRKSGGVWLVVPSSVEEYKERMENLGKKRHGLRHGDT